jgi:hypothetical protein
MIFLIRLVLGICLLILNCALQAILFMLLWPIPVMICLTRDRCLLDRIH